MTLTVNDLKSWLDAGKIVQIADVRAPSEYASGHIPGAISVPMEEAEARLADFSTNWPLVLACHSGTRAGVVCEQIRARHPEVIVVEGGTQAWIDAGLPVVQSARTRWSLERQVRLVAGFLVGLGLVLALTINAWWLALSGFVSLGLMFAGLTDICMMGMLFAKLPWNRAASPCPTPSAQTQP